MHLFLSLNITTAMSLDVKDLEHRSIVLYNIILYSTYAILYLYKILLWLYWTI